VPRQALRETIRVQDGRVPLLERHLARLRAGGCDDDTLARVWCEAEAAAAKWPFDYGRMTLMVSPDGDVTTDVSTAASSVVVPGDPVVALVRSDVPVLPQGAAKPADRSFWDGPLAAAQEAGADAAVLVSPNNELIDGSQATVWIRQGVELLTPMSPPALAGVSRGVVFDVAPDLGYLSREAHLTPDDYDAGEEVFLTTAVAGAVPVRGREGDAVVAIAAEFERLFHGTDIVT